MKTAICDADLTQGNRGFIKLCLSAREETGRPPACRHHGGDTGQLDRPLQPSPRAVRLRCREEDQRAQALYPR